jgi:HK97 family phage major capsid protein
MSQLKEKHAQILAQAQALIPKETRTAMTNAQSQRFDELMLEASKLRLDIEREEVRGSRPPRSQPGGNFEVNGAEKRAFAAYLKDGILDRSVLRESRDLSTGNAGVLIAQDFLPQLIEAKKAWGQLTTAVNQKRTANGEPMRVPGVDDTAQASTVIGESTTGNLIAAPEKDPTFAGSFNNVDQLSTGEIKISLAELQDSFFDLDAWIRDAFGKRIARGLSNLIVTGSGSGNFQSIITTAQQSVTSQLPATLGYLDFVALYSKLDPAYVQDACWVMNSTSRGLLLGQTDTLGRPLFVPSVNKDDLSTILGLPVVISQAHPNVGAGVVGAVQFGSLKDGYTLRTAGDVSILRLNERYADTGQVAFIGYHRNSGYATPVGAPIVNLVQHA